MKTIQDRVDDLARIMSTAGGSLTHLACVEADAIAALILTHGDEATATGVITNHTQPDELGEYGCDDDDSPHSHLYHEKNPARLDELTRAYIHAL